MRIVQSGPPIKADNEIQAKEPERVTGKVPAAYNPLLGFPRNSKCICGSGTKFKRCCLRLQSRIIPGDAASRIRANWDRLIAGRLLIVPPKTESEKTE